MSIEYYQGTAREIGKSLTGGDGVQGAQHRVQEAKKTNEAVAGLYENLMAKLGETAAVATELLDTAGLTGDQLNAAQGCTRNARVLGNVIFDTPNAAGVRQALQTSHERTESLDVLNARSYLELDKLLRPFFVAARNLQDLSNPAISEIEFDQAASAIAQAHQEMTSYGQHLE